VGVGALLGGGVLLSAVCVGRGTVEPGDLTSKKP
jgi:hypothetical protein